MHLYFDIKHLELSGGGGGGGGGVLKETRPSSEISQ